MRKKGVNVVDVPVRAALVVADTEHYEEVFDWKGKPVTAFGLV